jgi:hypothetical protein
MKDKLNILYIKEEDKNFWLCNEFLLNIGLYPKDIKPLKGEIGMIPSFKLMDKTKESRYKEKGIFFRRRVYYPTVDDLFFANMLEKSYRLVVK